MTREASSLEDDFAVEKLEDVLDDGEDDLAIKSDNHSCIPYWRSCSGETPGDSRHKCDAKHLQSTKRDFRSDAAKDLCHISGLVPSH